MGLSYVTTEFDEDEPSSQFFYDYSGFDGGVEYPAMSVPVSPL